MVSDTLLIGALALGGYVIYKSDISSGIGGIASGAGEAASGLGGGISTAAQGLGAGVADLSGQITSITGDVAELTAFVGEFGNWTAQQFTELQQRSLREATQENIIDEGAFQKTQDPLINIQAESDVFVAEQKAERTELRQEFRTDTTRALTSLPEAFAKAGSFLSIFKPASLISSWIASQASIEEQAAPQITAPTITGAATSTSISSTSTPTIRKVSTSGTSGSSGTTSSTGVQAGTYAVNVTGTPEINLSRANLKSLPRVVNRPRTFFQRIGGFLRGLGN